MKKVLWLIFILISLAALALSAYLYNRWVNNPEQVIPYPYKFSQVAPVVKVDAPIIIIGDRMGAQFAKFYKELAATISQNLSKPIAIESLAKPQHGIHRTIHELKSLAQWPQILIYQGGSEEFLENKFELSEIKKIRWNFKLYQDDRFQTSMILYPQLSRILYKPLKRTVLNETPESSENSDEYVKRLETELLLYEEHLKELVAMSKNRNALLILSTTPINYDVPPKKVCDFTSTMDIEKEILIVEEAMANNDYKKAYNLSSSLVRSHSGNAKLFYLHGQIAKKLNLIKEARESLGKSSAFECGPWRATEIQNAIIRRVAKNNQVLMFDFAKLIENDWNNNITFFDDLYPQNLYYEKGMKELGLVIKDILKL